MTLSPSMVVSIQAALADPDRPSYEQIAKFHGCSPRKVADIAAGAGPAGGASEKMEAIVALNAEGLTNYAIAKRTGKTQQAIGQMLARAKVLGFTIRDNRRYRLGKG